MDDHDLPVRGLRFVKRVPFQTRNIQVLGENVKYGVFSPQYAVPSSPAQPPVVVCICERPMGEVLCKKCQKRFKGRVRKKCPKDQSTFLMDHNICPDPNCGAGVENLEEVSHTQGK